jgi:signal transduction histidine kinase
MEFVLLAGGLLSGLVLGWVLCVVRRRPAARSGDAPRASAGDQEAIDVARIVDGVPVPALVVDRHGRVRHANGLSLQVFPQLTAGVDPGDFSASLAEVVRRGLAGEAPSAEDRVILGEPPRSVRIMVVRIESGALISFDDVTDDVDFEEARRTFSAAVSHELRTPLARILGLAETLALPDLDDEREELVTQIEHEVDGMRKLIDEMLLLAALDRGRLAVADGVVDASGVVVDVVQAARQRRIGRGRELTVSVVDQLEVPVAPRLFEVVVQNLVDNALLHGGPGAAVHVTVAAMDDQALITVADTGIGIPAQHLPFVFQRFYRGDASRTGPGSGLGLALVKHIVEAHGGSVAAESDGEHGTTLRVTLPTVG